MFNTKFENLMMLSPDGSGSGEIIDNETSTEDDNEVKTYTEEEVMGLLQKEADRRVTQALKKQKAEYEKKLSLSQLDADKRADAEKDMRIQELEDKLKNYAILENKNEIQKTLSGRGLDTAFADIITIGDDLDEAQERIETLDKLFKAAVAKEVKSRLGENSSKITTGNSTEALTKEQFKKLTLAQQAELYSSNKELYEKLTS